MKSVRFNLALSVLAVGLMMVGMASRAPIGGAPVAEAAAPPSDASGAKPAISALEAQIVFPGSRSQGQADAVVRPPAGCEILTLHAADGTKIAALFGQPARPAAGPRPALLFFYGNGMCMADSMDVFNNLRRLGFIVIMADYEGYGMSGGTPSEAGCYAAADAAYDYLLTRKEVDPKRIVVTGWSVGAAVAIDLASRRHVAGLVTFSAFTNTEHMSERVKAWTGPIVLATKFDNEAKIGEVACPIFMVHGTKDPLVDPAMLDVLAKAAKSKVTTLRLEGAEHNDLFQHGGDGLFQRVKGFVEGLAPVAPATRP